MKSPSDLYTVLQDSILSQEPLIEPYLHNPPKGTIADRIAIYADGFYSRLEETLLSDYQTLALLMGGDEFNHLCQLYVSSYPSCSYTLNFLGQHLSAFLVKTPPYDKKPYLAEIAFYEWAEAQAFTSADATILTAAQLQLLPPTHWPDMKIYLHPSCHLVQMHWNSFLLIKKAREGHKSRLRPKKIVNPQWVMVWRRQLQVRYYLLDNLEHTVIEAIKNKASFMQICEQLSHEMKDEDIACYLVKKLYAWLQEELFVQELLIAYDQQHY